MAAAAGDVFSKAMVVADKFDLKGNLTTAMTKYFENLENRNYTECGKLLRSGQLGEKGFLVGSMIQGMLKSYSDGQMYHHRTQLVLANLAGEVIKGQTSFQTQLLEIQASYVKLTEAIHEHYKTRQEDITKKMMDKQAKLEEIVLDPDSKLSDERVRIFADSIKQTKESLIEVLKAYYSASTSLVKANKIPEGFVEKCMEAQNTIMQSITGSINEIAKQQSSGLKSLIDGAKEIAFKLIDEKAKAKTLTFTPGGTAAAGALATSASGDSVGVAPAAASESKEQKRTP